MYEIFAFKRKVYPVLAGYFYARRYFAERDLGPTETTVAASRRKLKFERIFYVFLLLGFCVQMLIL